MSQTVEGERFTGRRSVGLVSLLTVAMASSTFPGFAYGVLAPHITEEFGLSRFAVGLLTTVFFAAGGLVSVLAGRLVDVLGAKRVMLTSFGLLTLATVGLGLSPDFGLMVLASCLAGFALATGNPVTNKLVAERVSPQRRGLAMGVKQAGVQAGAFLAGGLLAPAAGVWGWRAAVVATAVVPLAGAVATLLVVPADVTVARGAHRRRRVRVSPAIRRLAFYGFLMGFSVSTVNAYLPLYAVEGVGISAVRAGSLIAVMGVCGMASRVLWGWVSDRSGAYRGALATMAFGGAVAVLTGLFTGILGVPSGLMWFVALLLGLTAVAWNSVGMVAVLASSAPEHAGHASGVVVLGFYAGFVPSPLLFGALVDVTGGYTVSWSVVTLALLLAGTMISRPWPQYAPAAPSGS